mgnify:CR=1 FL=1
MGRRNRAFYRVGAFDGRTARGGKMLENLGHYDPLSPREEEQIKLDKEGIEKWLGQGAQLSETVRSFCRRQGVEIPVKKPRPKRRRGVQRQKKVARKLAARRARASEG